MEWHFLFPVENKTDTYCLYFWKIAQILNKKDLSFEAGAAKTGSARVASACYMLDKSIFMHNKWKEVRSSAQILT